VALTMAWVTKQTVVPKSRGGTAVKFAGVAKPAAAVAVFRDKNGAPLPAGSEVWLNGATEPAVIGFDGETYLANLQPSNEAVVKNPEGASCKATFDFTPQDAAQPRIDTVICAS